MSIWMFLFGKEMRESSRNYKWLWIPLVFVLLGLINPISTYYMPQILESGGLDAAAAKLIPIPTSGEIMAKSLSQYGTLGLLVLTLSFMGTMATERQSGSAIMVLVKKVSHWQYVLSKWAAMNVITLAAFLLGYLATWFYTELLFDSVPFTGIWKSMLLFALWLIFINTLTLLFSSMMKSTGGIAFVVLATAALLSLLTGLLKEPMQWSPSRLTVEAGAIVTQGQFDTGVKLITAVTACSIILLLWGAVTASKRMWTKN